MIHHGLDLISPFILHMIHGIYGIYGIYNNKISYNILYYNVIHIFGLFHCQKVRLNKKCFSYIYRL